MKVLSSYSSISPSYSSISGSFLSSTESQQQSDCNDDRCLYSARRNILQTVINVFFILSALVAGFLDVAVRDNLDVMSQKSKLALQVNAIIVVEAIKMQSLEFQVHNLTYESNRMGTIASEAYAESEIDATNADLLRVEAEQNKKLAYRELNRSSLFLARAAHGEQVRAELLQRIDQEMQNKTETLQELEKLSQGACAYFLINQICSIIGASAELKRSIEKEERLLIADYQDRDNITSMEFMDKIIALSYERNATEFNKTTMTLLQVAEGWEQRYKRDHDYATRYNLTAHEMQKQAKIFQAQEDRIEDEKANYTAAEDEDWLESIDAHDEAIQLALIGSFLAITSLPFFAFRLFLRSCAISGDILKSPSDYRSMIEYRRTMSQVLIHITIFLFFVGEFKIYLQKLLDFQWDERAVIFSWFSFIGASFQTIALQTVPHALAERPRTLKEYAFLGRQTFSRFVTLYTLFIIEILFVTVNMETGFLLKIATNMLSQTSWFILTMVLLWIHILFFEPRRLPYYQSSRDLNVKVAYYIGDDDDCENSDPENKYNLPLSYFAMSSEEISESTPLANVVRILSPAQSDYRIRSVEPIENPDATSESGIDFQSSPYRVYIQRELSHVLLALEIVVISCLIHVLQDCVPLATGVSYVKSTLVWFSILVTVVSMFAVLSPTSRGTSSTTESQTRIHRVLFEEA